MIPRRGQRPDEALARIREEIRRAQAEGLGRTGERLERVLADLAALDRELDALRARPSATPADHRRRREATDARDRLRAEALRLVENLTIQREALGIRQHAVVTQKYPVPPPRPLTGRASNNPDSLASYHVEDDNEHER